MPTILFYGVLHRDKTFENRSMSREEELLRDCLEEMIEAITRIETRFRGIESASDFTVTESGEIRMDAIAMMLVWLGESLKRLDRIGARDLLTKHPEAGWAFDFFGQPFYTPPLEFTPCIVDGLNLLPCPRKAVTIRRVQSATKLKPPTQLGRAVSNSHA